MAVITATMTITTIPAMTTTTTTITTRLPDSVSISVLLCVFNPTQHGRARPSTAGPLQGSVLAVAPCGDGALVRAARRAASENVNQRRTS
jgi:hypothetical protein